LTREKGYDGDEKVFGVKRHPAVDSNEAPRLFKANEQNLSEVKKY